MARDFRHTQDQERDSVNSHVCVWDVRKGFYSVTLKEYLKDAGNLNTNWTVPARIMELREEHFAPKGCQTHGMHVNTLDVLTTNAGRKRTTTDHKSQSHIRCPGPAAY